MKIFAKEKGTAGSPNEALQLWTDETPPRYAEYQVNTKNLMVWDAIKCGYTWVTSDFKHSTPKNALADIIKKEPIGMDLFFALFGEGIDGNCFEADFNPPGLPLTGCPKLNYTKAPSTLTLPTLPPPSPTSPSDPYDPVKQLFDYAYEMWLHDHLGALPVLKVSKSSGTESDIPSSSPILTTPPSSWQWCGNPQNSFDIKTPPVFKFTPHTTTWIPGVQGTCDLTDAAPIVPATSPRRPASDAVGNNFIEAKTTGGNTVTITERSHALIKAALENDKGIWIMICTDWTATKDHFHPENIIVIGPVTLKTAQLWKIPPTPPGAAASSPAELRMENNSYKLKFPSNGAGRNFSLEKSKDYTLHFHRPNGGSITSTPPPRTVPYTYPDPTTGPHTTNLYIYD